jgi:hypothetical protein
MQKRLEKRLARPSAEVVFLFLRNPSQAAAVLRLVEGDRMIGVRQHGYIRGAEETVPAELLHTSALQPHLRQSPVRQAGAGGGQ